MKRDFAIFKLAARSTLLWVIGVFILSAGVDIYIVTHEFPNILANRSSIVYLEDVISYSSLSFAYTGFAILLGIVLLIPVGSFKKARSNPQYLLGRLNCSNGAAVFWWGLYNTICLLAYRGLHLVVMYLLLKNHLEDVTYAAGENTLFLAFCRDEYLHSLLPMEHFSAQVMHIVLIVAVGMLSGQVCAFYQTSVAGSAVVFIYLAFSELVRDASMTGFVGGPLYITVIGLFLIGFVVYKTIKRGTVIHEENI